MLFQKDVVNCSTFLLTVMRIFLFYIVTFLNIFFVNGQKNINIPYEYHKDSSFYAATQVTDDTWWVSGENGVIKEVDRQGNVTNLPINLEGNDVFKMETTEKNVYIVGKGPSLFIINKANNQYKKYSFSNEFKNACFYDLAVLPNEQIVLCGGNNKIAHAQKTIPNGFIAIFNPIEEKIEKIRSKSLHFYFSITQSPYSQTLFASSYNGYQSVIYKSNDGKKWKPYKKVKGIIHDLMIDKNDHLWFSGTTAMNYQKTGMIGRIVDDKMSKITTDIGCLWRIIETNSEIVASSVRGDLLVIDSSNMQYKIEKTGFTKPIYTISINKYQEILMGGHGKSLKIRIPDIHQKNIISSVAN